jgi:hypothetical protein
VGHSGSREYRRGPEYFRKSWWDEQVDARLGWWRGKRSSLLQVVHKARNTCRETSRNPLRTSAPMTLAAMRSKCKNGQFANIVSRSSTHLQPYAEMEGRDQETIYRQRCVTEFSKFGAKTL